MLIKRTFFPHQYYVNKEEEEADHRYNLYCYCQWKKKKYRSIFLCFYCPARWVARYRHLNEIFIFFDLPPNYNADRYVTSYILPVSIEAILNINTCYLCQQTASLWEQMLLVKVHLIQADGFIQYVFVLIRNRSLSSFLLKFSKKKSKAEIYTNLFFEIYME